MYSFEECQTWRKKVSIRVEPTLYDRFKATIATRTHNKHRVSDILEDLMRGYVEKADNEEQSMPSDAKEESLQGAMKAADEPPTTERVTPRIVPQLQVVEESAQIRIEGATLFMRQIGFTAYSIHMYDFYCAKIDPNITLPNFVNAVIRLFFENAGAKSVIEIDEDLFYQNNS